MSDSFNKMLLIVPLSFIGVCSQFLIKKGLNKIGSFTIGELGSNIFLIFTNVYILIALGLLVLLAIAYFSLMSRMELSSLYPTVVGINFLILFLGSRLLLNESMSIYKIFGVVLILSGVFCLNYK